MKWITISAALLITACSQQNALIDDDTMPGDAPPKQTALGAHEQFASEAQRRRAEHFWLEYADPKNASNW